MKIALISPFYPYRGGIAQFSDRLYTELAKSNEVKVFSYSTLYPKTLFPGKSQFVPNPVANELLPSHRTLSSIAPCSHSATAKEVNEFAPDVVLVAYWTPYMAIALSRVCKKLDKGIKIIGLVHNALPHERTWFDKTLAKKFLNKCHAYIMMSASVEADVKQLGLSQPTLVLNHPIYDHYPAKTDKQSAIRELDIAFDKKTILFFGLIRSYKGLDLLIEAMGMLDDTYQLVIAGESYTGFKSYQQLIDLSANRNNIKVFEEYIPDEKVSLLFSATDVLMLPYRTATQSGVVAVGYQFTTPMIATDVGGLADAIRKPDVGLVVKELTAKSIASAIKDFFDSDYQALYGENLEKEKTRLSWKSFSQSVEQFSMGLKDS